MLRVFASSLLLALLTTGCTLFGGSDREAEAADDGRVDPVEAMEEVNEPRRDAAPPQDDPDGLSRDIERLQDARRKYDQERDREAAEMRRRQDECRERADSREVPVQDGGEKVDSMCLPSSEPEPE